MAAPNSAVDICNIALDYLSQRPISSIDPPHTEAEETMARHYDMIRQELLRNYVWNFAKAHIELTATGESPVTDYPYAFNLPTDCLRVLSIGGETEMWQTNRYDIIGRKIITDYSETKILLRYVKDVTDVGQWDSGFVKLMSLALAESVAYTFTQQSKALENINALYTAHIAKAVSIDGQEKKPIRIQRSKYLSARNGAYSNDPRYYRFE